MKELEKVYNPLKVEDAMYDFWMKGEYFKATVDASKKPYTIVMPPPNITGQLHMGHAMDETWQDILIRFKRMQGYSALWVPGTDHASIATEARIVAEMATENITKENLGRDEFLKRAWKWKEKYGGRIVEQLKKLGASCDWSRERFTMDEGCSEAVNFVFKKLYNEGLIYRGERIINWCPHCLTSISDAEVEHEEQQGFFWHIKYCVEGSENEFVEIATTRPETLLGDTAVAVHPNDERYAHLHGKNVILPLVGRVIPIICDEYVDKEFGTGAVKITPAHDPNDFEVGRRHNLPIIKILTDDAHINQQGGKYVGMDRSEARKEIVKDLQMQGLLAKTEERNHNVGTCYRCSTTIEPMVSLQWFVKMESLAKPAIEAVKDGTIKYVPQRFAKTYFHWMENTRDWCISRQLWWGHRIPAWYCDDCGEISISDDVVDACKKCSSANVRQDEDTLDTWFSSALWPFSTLGWPKNTEDLEYFYPTNTLVTAYDIIGFWVSRMIFSGLHNMEKAPFNTVLIHGLVRDAQGRKMSKSLGNGIDPLEIINEYGADALRLTLVMGSTLGNDTRFQEEKVRSSRNFANKLWNATRFVLMNLPEEFECGLPNENELELSDKWAISLYNELVESVTDNLDKFEFGLAAQKVHDFIWDIFCDWTIEIAKVRLNSGDEKLADNARKVLVWLLTGALKLLHPFMPFITEKIYHVLPNEQPEAVLISANWPVQNDAWKYEKEQQNFGCVIELVRAIRTVRTEMGVHPAKRTRLIIETLQSEAFEAGVDVIQKLAGVEDLECTKQFTGETAGMVQIATPVARGFIPMMELVDKAKEVERLEKEVEHIIKEINTLQGRLDNKGFVDKAPEQVVQGIRDKLEKAKDMHDKLKESVKALG